ncbi:MAG: AbrB/MazE/SpoVT family DNA-binding domain-containing protein [Halanaerobiales bacterium]|nr:AbrB/MazE/SpoVT family DNA-binding domain-containing protein [Halanaerobiales bacterium]
MKATGIVRKVDQLGRYVIPKELRKTMKIEENQTKLEVFIVDKDTIALKRFESQLACSICGDPFVGSIMYKGKRFCVDCIKGLQEEL